MNHEVSSGDVSFDAIIELLDTSGDNLLNSDLLARPRQLALRNWFQAAKVHLSLN
jgi:hypothetical protein